MIFKTGYKPQTLFLKVVSNTGYTENIRVIVEHPQLAYTQFINRKVIVEPDKPTEVYLRLPLNPEFVSIKLYNERLGQKPGDKSFAFVLKKMPLTRRLDAFDYLNPKVISFIEFAEEFSCKAGSISTQGIMYKSDDDRFCIDYVANMGRNTPASVRKSTKIISVNRSTFIRYTVPMRFLILLHEFSHVYINDTPENEIEADINALAIYLGLGYPRIEAYDAFLNVFTSAPTDQNGKRYKMIEQYITDFEENRQKSISAYC